MCSDRWMASGSRLGQEMIDDSAGFHELGDKSNQLEDMERHCREIAEHFTSILERTRQCVPLRAHEHKLERKGDKNPDKSQTERLLERSIWKKWCHSPNLPPRHYMLPFICRSVATYQMPLQKARADANWGKVDLVGVSRGYTPVIIELKKERGDTPLRMLVEAVGYAVAVREAWASKKTHLYEDWKRRVTECNHGGEFLSQTPIVCIAPWQYWFRRIGEPGPQTEGRVFPKAWPSFRRLVNLCSVHGFPVTFAAFEPKYVENSLPEVFDFRAIEILSCSY